MSSEKPFLMNFLQLSHAPPEFDMEIASCTEEKSDPVRRPNAAFLPNTPPKKSGERITKAPGAIISFTDDFVEMEMHLS